MNQMRGFHILCTQISASRPLCKKVLPALGVLMEFFEERRKACCDVPLNARPSATVIESERRLCDQFYNFFEAMNAHDFSLDMDMGGLMPANDKWSHFAVVIADDFKQAMTPNNPTLHLGISNEGPVPSFVQAVVPMMTGEEPSVWAVAQCLKRRARKMTAAPNTTVKE